MVADFDGEVVIYSTKYSCPHCELSFEELTPRLFSFNNPYGACPHCTGLGFTQRIDPKLLIRDENMTLREGGIKANGWYIDTSRMARNEFKALADAYGFSLDVPIKDLPESALNVIFYGTEGDPIEIEALKEVFEQYTDKRSYCKVGSVKTNIGHLEGCAAMASLIKVVLMLQNKMIPKSLHLNQVNPVLNVKNSPFEFVNESTEWKRLEENIPLRAGISSFGIGGTNSHVLVEEFCPDIENKDKIKLDQKKSFFILSARTQKSLNLALENWKSNINNGNLDTYKLEDISNVLMKSRWG